MRKDPKRMQLAKKLCAIMGWEDWWRVWTTYRSSDMEQLIARLEEPNGTRT